MQAQFADSNARKHMVVIWFYLRGRRQTPSLIEELGRIGCSLSIYQNKKITTYISRGTLKLLFFCEIKIESKCLVPCIIQQCSFQSTSKMNSCSICRFSSFDNRSEQLEVKLVQQIYLGHRPIRKVIFSILQIRSGRLFCTYSA